MCRSRDSLHSRSSRDSSFLQSLLRIARHLFLDAGTLTGDFPREPAQIAIVDDYWFPEGSERRLCIPPCRVPYECHPDVVQESLEFLPGPRFIASLIAVHMGAYRHDMGALNLGYLLPFISGQ